MKGIKSLKRLCWSAIHDKIFAECWIKLINNIEVGIFKEFCPFVATIHYEK